MNIPSSFRVYTLGPKNSFSDILARKLYPNTKIYHLKTISDLIEEASKGEKVLVPCENSIDGMVGETIRKIREIDNIYINREICYPIDLCLGGLGKEEDVNVVHSHPKAINQCLNYLNEKGIIYKEVSSTSEAAKKVKEYGKDSIGVICSKEALKEYGLNLLKEKIQDNLNNYTIFWELSNEEISPNYNKKIGTAMIVDLDNESGALYKFLKPFDDERINLYFINSWPEDGIYWCIYWFLIKTEADKDRPDPMKLKKECKKLRYLGSYNRINLK